MQTRHLHVLPRDGCWAVQAEGNLRATRRFERKEDAIRFARAAARNQGVDMVIHRQDGTIQTRDHYGAPAPAAGKPARF